MSVYRRNLLLTLVSIIIIQIRNPISISQAHEYDGSCGKPRGNCDYLITISTFQVGTCGRAARCYWELMHLSKTLDSDDMNANATIVESESKICKALRNIPTYEMYKSTVEQNHKNIYSIFENGMPENDSRFDHYPMPTLYYANDKSNLDNILECRGMELECTKKLEARTRSLCSSAIKEDTKSKFESSIKLIVRNKPMYRIAWMSAGESEDGHKQTKCTLHVLTRRKSGSDISTYQDEYAFNTIERSLRPPYFDLSVLYSIDKDGRLANEDWQWNWWNETKAYPELAHYLPIPMVKSIHYAIKHVYDTRGNLLSHHHKRKNSLEWKPEKFCWYTSTLACVDKHKLNNFNINRCKETAENSTSDAEDNTGSRIGDEIDENTKNGETTTEENKENENTENE